ncbi:MAG TPA: hydroxymethylbilane synthase [Solirubrobacteraceae bacterium]|jgi:hydroxymethylbilane synthase|nr:hydroxymethylbilane synthase [Solirubrobacteraceae bacterium]
MRLGTRASALALAQAELVAELLQATPEAMRGAGAGAVEIVPIVTRGDRESAAVDDTAGELAGDGAPGEPPPGEDKSRWVAELERALAEGEIDAAVHSAKDVPGELGEGLVLVAAPRRAAAEDVLCGVGEGVDREAGVRRGVADLDALASGARVGTSSVRRIAQLRAAREDLELVAMRGNVDTRLRKLAAGEFDAIVLARAGLQRLSREREAGAALDPERFVPAPGQGTLALQARAEDAPTRAALAAIGDGDALASLLAERALARALGASCNTPLGAWASIERGRTLTLRAWIGLPDGSSWIADQLSGEREGAEQLGESVADRLRSAGAVELLAQAEEMVP